MKKIYFLLYSTLLTTVLSCEAAGLPMVFSKNIPSGNILYFNPEIYPDIPEIRDATYTAFYSAVDEKENQIEQLKMLRVDSYVPFESVEPGIIREFCNNNGARMAVVPKVKFFKVGLGKYVFSNQVIVSMKLFDAQGNLLAETQYDTYKRNARLLGSAENSIKIGATGAISNMTKALAKVRRNHVPAS